jgi:endonuclease YncB( thermonuclease family)
LINAKEKAFDIMRRKPAISLVRPPARKPTLIQRYGPVTAMGLAISAAVGLGVTQMPVGRVLAATSSDDVGCADPRVVDGDTLRCGGTRIRLQGIDAPELPGHCARGRACTPGDPFASTDNLRALVSGATMVCRQTDTDRYGRTVARCSVRGRDLSCAQIAGGFAVRRYAPISCP